MMVDLLADAGEALYGPRWQTSLAAALGVADRTVRRWHAGTTPVPPGVYADLLRLVQQRGETLGAVADRLRERG